MGYDLHISKSHEWFDSERDPISYEEFRNAALARPGWTVDAPVTGRAGRAARCEYRNPANLEASISACWCEGRITASKPGPKAVPELVAVADTLGAMVVGDECERYFADGSRREYEP